MPSSSSDPVVIDDYSTIYSNSVPSSYINDKRGPSLDTAYPQKPTQAFHPVSIVHDDDEPYEQVRNIFHTGYPPRSPHDPNTSYRTSLSSGSVFSHVDSPVDSLYTPDIEHGITSPERARNKSIISNASNDILGRREYGSGPLGLIEDEKMTPSTGRRGSSKDPIYTSSSPNSRQTQFQTDSQIWGAGKTEQDNNVAQEVKPMWWIMLYLMITNPLICIYNAFFTIIITFVSVFYIPFTKDKTSAFITNKLSGPLFVHFRTFSSSPFKTTSKDLNSMRLIFVHLGSPFIAAIVYLASLVLGIVWLYDIMLSDSDSELESLRASVLRFWSRYLNTSLQPRRR